MYVTARYKVTNLSTSRACKVRYCDVIVCIFYRSYEQYAVIEFAYFDKVTVSSDILMLRGGFIQSLRHACTGKLGRGRAFPF
jgi:hypothetical protein